MTRERDPDNKKIVRRQWLNTIRQYDVRTGYEQAPTKRYQIPKSTTGQSAKAKGDIFARSRRLDGRGSGREEVPPQFDYRPGLG